MADYGDEDPLLAATDFKDEELSDIEESVSRYSKLVDISFAGGEEEAKSVMTKDSSADAVSSSGAKAGSSKEETLVSSNPSSKKEKARASSTSSPDKTKIERTPEQRDEDMKNILKAFYVNPQKAALVDTLAPLSPPEPPVLLSTAQSEEMLDPENDVQKLWTPAKLINTINKQKLQLPKENLGFDGVSRVPGEEFDFLFWKKPWEQTWAEAQADREAFNQAMKTGKYDVYNGIVAPAGAVWSVNDRAKVLGYDPSLPKSVRSQVKGIWSKDYETKGEIVDGKMKGQEAREIDTAIPEGKKPEDPVCATEAEKEAMKELLYGKKIKDEKAKTKSYNKSIKEGRKKAARWGLLDAEQTVMILGLEEAIELCKNADKGLLDEPSNTRVRGLDLGPVLVKMAPKFNAVLRIKNDIANGLGMAVMCKMSPQTTIAMMGKEAAKRLSWAARQCLLTDLEEQQLEALGMQQDILQLTNPTPEERAEREKEREEKLLAGLDAVERRKFEQERIKALNDALDGLGPELTSKLRATFKEKKEHLEQLLSAGDVTPKGKGKQRARDPEVVERMAVIYEKWVKKAINAGIAAHWARIDERDRKLESAKAFSPAESASSKFYRKVALKNKRLRATLREKADENFVGLSDEAVRVRRGLRAVQRVIDDEFEMDAQIEGHHYDYRAVVGQMKTDKEWNLRFKKSDNGMKAKGLSDDVFSDDYEYSPSLYDYDTEEYLDDDEALRRAIELSLKEKEDKKEGAAGPSKQ